MTFNIKKGLSAAAATAVLGTVLLTGCGSSSSSSDNNTSSSSSSSSSTPATSNYTVTVSGLTGITNVQAYDESNSSIAGCSTTTTPYTLACTTPAAYIKATGSDYGVDGNSSTTADNKDAIYVASVTGSDVAISWESTMKFHGATDTDVKAMKLAKISLDAITGDSSITDKTLLEMTGIDTTKLRAFDPTKLTEALAKAISNTAGSSLDVTTLTKRIAAVQVVLAKIQEIVAKSATNTDAADVEAELEALEILVYKTADVISKSTEESDFTAIATIVSDENIAATKTVVKAIKASGKVVDTKAVGTSDAISDTGTIDTTKLQEEAEKTATTPPASSSSSVSSDATSSEASSTSSVSSDPTSSVASSTSSATTSSSSSTGTTTPPIIIPTTSSSSSVADTDSITFTSVTIGGSTGTITESTFSNITIPTGKTFSDLNISVALTDTFEEGDSKIATISLTMKSVSDSKELNVTLSDVKFTGTADNINLEVGAGSVLALTAKKADGTNASLATPVSNASVNEIASINGTNLNLSLENAIKQFATQYSSLETMLSKNGTYDVTVALSGGCSKSYSGKLVVGDGSVASSSSSVSSSSSSSSSVSSSSSSSAGNTTTLTLGTDDQTTPHYISGSNAAGDISNVTVVANTSDIPTEQSTAQGIGVTVLDGAPQVSLTFNSQYAGKTVTITYSGKSKEILLGNAGAAMELDLN